jgi:CRISPR-associated protein (TIGR02710 family)
MNKGLVLTVGTGRNREDIAHALSYSIKHHNPSLILFLASPKSQEETLPLILADKVIKEIPHAVIQFNEVDDVEELCRFYRESILQWIKEHNLSSQEIIADYTSGTKSMSAALLSEALDLNLPSLSYVSGKRDEQGRVVPGKERLTILSPIQLQAENQLRKAIQFFNAYQYAATLELLHAIPETLEEGLQQKKQFLLLLADTYLAWDLFHLEKASQTLKEWDKYQALALAWRILNRLENHLQFLYQEKGKPYTLYRMADLVNNAKRRMEEKRFDDALGRIYRAFEYLAQLRLFAEYQKDTAALKIQDIPPALAAKYEGRGNRIYPGLYGSYELLMELNDSLGKEFLEDYHRKDAPFRKQLEQRNHSILAHGFHPIEASAAQSLFDQLILYLDKYYPDWQRLSQQAAFPQITPLPE